jgi:hypothetical protein
MHDGVYVRGEAGVMVEREEHGIGALRCEVRGMLLLSLRGSRSTPLTAGSQQPVIL